MNKVTLYVLIPVLKTKTAHGHLQHFELHSRPTSTNRIYFVFWKGLKKKHLNSHLVAKTNHLAIANHNSYSNHEPLDKSGFGPKGDLVHACPKWTLSYLKSIAQKPLLFKVTSNNSYYHRYSDHSLKIFLNIYPLHLFRKDLIYCKFGSHLLPA